MSIRLKLILAYFAMVAFSIIVLIIGMVKVTSEFFVELSQSTIGDHSFDEVASGAINVLIDIEYMLKYEPDLFEDQAHMKELEGQIEPFDMYVFVERDGKFIYNSVYNTDLDLEKYIPELNFDESETYKNGERSPLNADSFSVEDEDDYMVFRHEIDKGYIYVVYDHDEMNTFGQQAYAGMFKWVLIVIILLLVFMTITITKMVIEPLNKLENGTLKIRQGNLDFSVKTRKTDEIGRVMNAFDIMREELKASIEQQLQYEENRKELITSISHDLKTPITSIKGYVEGIRDGVANDEEKLNRYLEVIYDKSVDLDRLIDDLFLFSKLDLNRVPFNFSNVQAKRFFDDSYEEIKLDLDKADFEFDYTNQLNEADLLLIDSQQFKRVMTNIISNAVKYSNEKKRVELNVESTEEEILVKVTDFGQGIHPDDVAHIFDKFYRCDPSRNSDIGGSGLGLAIAKQIIDQHQGTIEAESEIGIGTTITIKLRKHEGDQHE